MRVRVSVQTQEVDLRVCDGSSPVDTILIKDQSGTVGILICVKEDILAVVLVIARDCESGPEELESAGKRLTPWHICRGVT